MCETLCSTHVTQTLPLTVKSLVTSTRVWTGADELAFASSTDTELSLYGVAMLAGALSVFGGQEGVLLVGSRFTLSAAHNSDTGVEAASAAEYEVVSQPDSHHVRFLVS